MNIPRVVALALLVFGCSTAPSSTPLDAPAADTAPLGDVSADAPAGACPEAQRVCNAFSGDDLCVRPNGGGYTSVLACVTSARESGCALPPACGVCARGARLWREADLQAHNAARVALGMCPDYGDAGVPVASIRE